MSSHLERQADRAERLADQTVNAELRETLLNAAREYREKADSGADADVAEEHRPTWFGLGDSLSESPRAKTGF